MTDRESPIQASIVEWIRTVVPEAEGFVFSVPNGIWTSRSQASKARWTGVLEGMPDLGFCTSMGRVLWLEVKPPKYRGPSGKFVYPSTSAEQDKIHARLSDLDHPVAVVTSIDDVRAIFETLGIPTKESKS